MKSLIRSRNVKICERIGNFTHTLENMQLLIHDKIKVNPC